MFWAVLSLAWAAKNMLGCNFAAILCAKADSFRLPTTFQCFISLAGNGRPGSNCSKQPFYHSRKAVHQGLTAYDRTHGKAATAAVKFSVENKAGTNAGTDSYIDKIAMSLSCSRLASPTAAALASFSTSTGTPPV